MPVELLAAMSADPEHVEEALRPAFEQHLLEVRTGTPSASATRRCGRWCTPSCCPLSAPACTAVPPRRSRDMRRPSGRAGEVARHWHLAGDLERALVTSVEAGYAAERIYAFADAHTSFTRAVELMDALTGDDLPPEVGLRDRPDLLEHAARAASAVGDHDEAVRLVTAALAQVEEQPPDRIRLLERLAAFEFFAGAVTARRRRTARLWSSWPTAR